MLARNDFIALSPIGGAEMIYLCVFGKNDLDFKLVFNGNYTSIIHHFRDIDVFLLAGIDVIAISPLGGAEGDLTLRILRERPRLYISVQR